MADKQILCAFGVDLTPLAVGWVPTVGRTHLMIFLAAYSPGKWERPAA